MDSSWGNKEDEESTLSKHSKKIGIGAVVAVALILVAIIFVFWWLHGYDFIIAPTGEIAFEALNSTA